MKKVIFGKEAKEKLIEGIDLVADTVKITLGPSGKYVVIGKPFGPPAATKDGVTVAKSISSSDQSINAGCEMMKQVSLQQLEMAGDGTTTATVLAQRIIHMYKDSKKSPREIRDSFKLKTEYILRELDKINKPLETDEELMAVAIIATNGDEELGGHVFDAIKASGKDGEVVVENSKNSETKVVSYPGYMFERGYVSHHFAGVNAECKLDDVYILFCDEEIKDWQDIRHIAEAVTAQRRELLIVCKDMAEPVLGNLIMNIQQGRLRSCVVKLPALRNRGEILLEDLAIKTGGKVISPKKKGHMFKNITLEHLGRCDTVTVDKEKTVLVGEKGSPDKVEERRKQIESDLKKADKLEIILQKERYAKFIGGVSVLYVGGHSDVELKERKDRIDDAVRATKEALKEGIIPGGGYALHYITSNMSNMSYYELNSPTQAIADNCNESIVSCDFPYVYDYAKRIEGNYIELGIIDPLSVVKQSVINAYSLATLVLSTESLVVSEEFDMEGAVLEGIDQGKNRF
jgi:chaperonin GroEL